MSDRFAIAIPAYEAERTVGAVIRRALRFAPVVVVDDGSPDGTGDRARAQGVTVLVHDVNLGKGCALRTAFSHLLAQGFDAVVTLDADGQHPPEEVPRLVDAWRGGADLVLGTRDHLYDGMSRVRRTSNASSSWLISRVAGRALPDCQTGFRVYARRLLETVGFPESRFEAESAVLVRAARRGFRIVGVPIHLDTVDGRATSHYRPVVDSLRIARAVTRARLELAMSGGVVLVTGGTRGIGRAVVEMLLAEGRAVAFTYRESEAAAREIVAGSQGRARAYALDLVDRARPGVLLPEIEERQGVVEGLVNNAAIRRDALLASTPDADWDEIIDANLGAAFRCCRAVLPGMIARRAGSIVNVASLTALRGVAGQASYGASKAGLIGLTKSLAREVGRRNVRVNAVVPGLVMTEMVASTPPERLQALRAIEALPSGTSPEDVAATIVFLLSDRARAITGQAILVDAGSTADVLARLISRFARVVASRPVPILGAALLVAALGLVPAGRLAIRSDVLALLPDDAPAAAAYRTFLSAFGGIESVFIVVRGPDGAAPDPEGLADAAEVLAGELSRAPEIAHARWGLDADDETFFVESLAPRLPLLLGSDAAAELAPRLTDEAIDARARALHDAVSGPGALFLSRLAAADPLGLAEGKLRELAAGSRLPFDPITGALLSADGRAALVVATPVMGESDAAGGRTLAKALEGAYAGTRAAAGEDLRFDAVGGPLYAAHDEVALRWDLIRIVTTASILIVLLIVLAFEDLAIPAISIATVAAGQVVCAAIVAWGYGPVTAVGVGFAAILLGLGDDFTLHLAARVRAAWRSGAAPDAAVTSAIVETAPGIVAAALTTAAAFGCLAFAHFRPLRELGLVVALGILLLLAATAFVAAPLLTLAARRWARRPPREPRLPFGAVVEAGVRWGGRWPRGVLLAALAGTALAAAGIARLEIDTDLRRMRPEDHPSLEAERRLLASFPVPLDTATITVPGADAEQALDRAAEVASIVRSRLTPAVEISAPSDWIVSGERAARRLESIRGLGLDRAADRLARALDREGLRPEAFAPALDAMRLLAQGRDPEPLPLDRYPAWMREGLRVGERGAIAAVRVRVPTGTWAAGPPPELVDAIRRAAPGAAIASAPALGAELRALALSDLRRLGTLAVVAVFVLVVLSYRGDVRAAAWTFVPVALGTIWTAGAWGWFGRPLDLFSLCVLPVMVGIGIDDGLHVLHLARRQGHDLVQAAREAGRGVVLTNLTTSAGFAALAVSHVPALRNGGWIVCVGNLLCLAATLVVLPALATLAKRR